jgi:hypothetical protein
VDIVEQGGGEVGGGMLPPVLNAGGGGGGAVFHQQNGEGDFILSFNHIFAPTGAHLLSCQIQIQV